MTTIPHKLRAGEPAPLESNSCASGFESAAQWRTITAQVSAAEEEDGPRAAFVILQGRLQGYRSNGQDVPAAILALERRLLAACCSESQGR